MIEYLKKKLEDAKNKIEEKKNEIEEMKNNFLHDTAKTVERRLPQVSHELTARLSQMSVEQLSELTQMLGGLLSVTLFNAKIIFEEIVRRARDSKYSQQQKTTIKVEISTQPRGEIIPQPRGSEPERPTKRIFIVSPSTSDEEIQKIGAEIDAAIEQKKVVTYIVIKSAEVLRSKESDCKGG